MVEVRQEFEEVGCPADSERQTLGFMGGRQRLGSVNSFSFPWQPRVRPCRDAASGR
jgi:hypothetical protein